MSDQDGKVTPLRKQEDVYAPPIAECLICGHEQPLAVWRDILGRVVLHDGTGRLETVGQAPPVGVCEGCRDLAAANRGPCEPARDCGCWHRSMQSEERP